MLTAALLAAVGGLVGYLFRVTMIIVFSMTIFICQMMRMAYVGDFGASEVVLLLGYLSAAQGGFLVGVYLGS